MIQTEHIDCDFETRPVCLYTKRAPEILKREQSLAEACGIHASFHADSELPFSVAGVLQYENQASFHPLKFLRALEGRLELYENTRVLSVENHIIQTELGKVRA